MAKYLLDTSVIIDALNEKRSRTDFLIDLAGRGGLACCPINVAEVYAGALPREEEKTSALLRSLQLYPITFSVAELAGRLKRTYGQKGKTLSIPDTVIAAVALHYGLTLVTDNARDFPMSDLSLHPMPD
jgi:predicted nucleic acid-binding protein